MKKIETLINKLHEVADFVDRTGMSEDVELIGECIDLACDIKDGKEDGEETELSQEVIDVLNKNCNLILHHNGLHSINGSFCNYEIIEELDNGWHVSFEYGTQDESGSSKTEFTTYLRKDTLEFTDDEEEVIFEPEDD